MLESSLSEAVAILPQRLPCKRSAPASEELDQRLSAVPNPHPQTGLQAVLERAAKPMNGLQQVNWSQLRRQRSAVTSLAFQLDSEIHELRKQLSLRESELDPANLTGEDSREGAEEDGRIAKSLRQKEELAFLLSRVSPGAQKKLLTDDAFRQQFSGAPDCGAFVLSVDIRRSTELMLRARSAMHFARFLTHLCEDIEAVTRENLGIFDKFTGDGTLAFFPDFFSGADAGYLSLQTARRCHEAFAARYKEHRSSFSPVLNDVGLGIGIDHGSVNLLHMSHGLTIVGGAVVYACRLAGAPPHRTYVNQPAFDLMKARHEDAFTATETAIEIKHEGRILCHDVELNGSHYQPKRPQWMDADPAIGSTASHSSSCRLF